MKSAITKKIDLNACLPLIGFLKNAYDDYISARILLNSNSILQGVILANTSIEKYFKAILTFKGDTVKHSHSIIKLLPSIKNYDNILYDKFDIEFMELLDKSYILRYINSAPANFKVVLFKKKILAELDYVISLLHEKITINTNKRYRKSNYQHDIDSNRTELLENNFLLGNLTKEEYLLGIEDVHELFVDNNGNVFEILYQTIIERK